MNSKLKAIWQIAKGTRLRYFSAIFAMLITAALLFLIPQVFGICTSSLTGQKFNAPEFLQPLIDHIGGGEYLIQNLWVPATAILVLTILGGLFSFLSSKLAAQSAEKMCQTLRNKLYKHMQLLPCKFHDQSETGDLIQRCTSDVETIRMFIHGQLPNIFRITVMLAAATFFMFPINFKMACYALLCVPLIVGFSLFFFSRVRKTFRDSDEAEGAMTAMIQENLTNIRVVKAFARKNYEIGRFAEANSDYQKKWFRLIRILAIFWSSTDVLCLGQIALIMWIGAQEAQQGRLTAGDFQVFILYLNLYLWPMRSLGRVLSHMGKAFVSIERIEHILHEAEEENPSAPELVGKTTGLLEMRNVSFAHVPGVDAIKNISFTLEPGKTLAIVGPSGSGKSTIISLLLKLYDLQKGEIFIDGIPYSKLTRQDVRKQFGTVLQEPFLFSRTLGDNIKIGNSAVSHDLVEEAVSHACLDESIERFDDGYDTMVGERGVTLSGGQRQRVAIARALLMDCPVMIFDDALSAVDMQTEKTIIDALKNSEHKQSKIVIAHRISSLKHADKIIVLEHGEISQTGTHDQLIEKPGLYKRLWQVQFDLQEDLKKELAKKPIKVSKEVQK